MLDSIVLEDFKSFRRTGAPLGRLSLLVGTNASGKSNLREALRVLHGVGLGYTMAEILGEKYGPGGILQWRGIRGGAKEAAFEGADTFSIAAEIGLPADPGQVFTYQLRVDVSDLQTGPRVVAESLHGPGGFIFDSHPEGDRLVLLRVCGRDRSLAFSSARPVLTQIAQLEGLGEAATCRAVLDALASIRFLDPDPDAIRQPSQPGQVILGERGENLSSVLRAICEDHERRRTLLEWLRALTPMDATDFTFRSDFMGKVLVHLVESGGFEVSALSASDGTLRFLALVAALLSEDSGRIYFFEEFDNGIHPTRLHLLLDLVQRACESMKVQVIGTTHNPALLANLDERARREALLVVRSEYTSGSRLVPILNLPDAERVLAAEDLGRLHQAGWLEDAAVFSEADEPEASNSPRGGTEAPR